METILDFIYLFIYLYFKAYESPFSVLVDSAELSQILGEILVFI